MRIVNRQEFLKQPDGTLYSEYEPRLFLGLFVKRGTISSGDYLEESLIGNVASHNSEEYFDVLDAATSAGAEFSLEFGTSSRNGVIDKDQLYAIYSNDDLAQLINYLSTYVK